MKIFRAGEKVAQLNRTSSRRNHDEPSQERTMSLHALFCAAVGNSFGYTLIRLAGEGRNKSNSCLSLLARSVPTCPPEVDDAHGLFFVRGLIANMATIPKPVVPACDWRENDPLLTPQQSNVRRQKSRPSSNFAPSRTNSTRLKPS